MDLDAALARAESENKLVAVVLSREGSEDGGFRAVAKEALVSQPVVVFETESHVGALVWRGTDLPRLPMVCFLDKSGEAIGQVIGPASRAFTDRWTSRVVTAWKRHDSLVFRAKGRLSDKDSALLAFSYACRSDVAKASSLVARADPRRMTPDQELAQFALGQAFWLKGRRDRAAEAFGALRASRTARDLRVLARLNYAELVEPTRHDDAIREVREVLAAVDLDVQERWLANDMLKRFSETVTR